MKNKIKSNLYVPSKPVAIIAAILGAPGFLFLVICIIINGIKQRRKQCK